MADEQITYNPEWGSNPDFELIGRLKDEIERLRMALNEICDGCLSCNDRIKIARDALMSNK